MLAGRFTAGTATLDLVLESGDGTMLHKRVELAAPPLGEQARPASSRNAGRGCASTNCWRSRAAPHRDRALGNRFGIVTPETSLIVLEALPTTSATSCRRRPARLRDA